MAINSSLQSYSKKSTRGANLPPPNQNRVKLARARLKIQSFEFDIFNACGFIVEPKKQRMRRRFL